MYLNDIVLFLKKQIATIYSSGDVYKLGRIIVARNPGLPPLCLMNECTVHLPVVCVSDFYC